MLNKFCIAAITITITLFACKSPTESDSNDVKSLGNPSLVSPDNGTELEDTSPTFKWKSINEATGYEISVDKNSSFSSPDVNEETESSPFTPTTNLSTGKYYWKVRAKGPDKKWGDWSSVWNFTIIQVIPPPEAPTLSGPEKGSTTSNTTPLFSWSPVDNAVKYELIVDNNSNWSSPVIHNSNLSETDYTPTSSLPADKYYWRVRAVNENDQKGDWSSTWNFTIREADKYEQLLIGGWKASYADLYYNVYSEYLFTDSGEISSYTAFYSNVYTNFATLYTGTFQVLKNGGNYYISYNYTSWDLPPEITPYPSGGMQFKFNSQEKLQILMSTGYGNKWITYSRL